MNGGVILGTKMLRLSEKNNSSMLVGILVKQGVHKIQNNEQIFLHS